MTLSSFVLKSALITVFGLAGFAGPISAAAYEIPKPVYETKAMPINRHMGPGQWDSYLIMDLPFAPVAELFKQLLIAEKMPLSSRGEAHITVVTPMEYWNILRPQGVTMDEINQLAEKSDLQGTPFTMVCLGKGQAEVEKKVESTFYVVVESKGLLNLRGAIQKLYIAKGGKAAGFDPDNYFPHITVGFTKRDLHDSDGVIKNRKSCITDIKLSKSGS